MNFRFEYTVAVILIAMTAASAETLVSGTGATTTTIRVPKRNTLTIQPGVDVRFRANVGFFVEGILRATGTRAPGRGAGSSSRTTRARSRTPG